MTALTWHEWGEEALAKASAEKRPVLLLLTASWCRHSRQLLALFEQDAELARLASEVYVAIHADKDRRPDLNDRFNMGGWPSVALLTADQDLIAGGTSLSIESLRALLVRVARLVAEHGDRLAAKLQERLREEDAKERHLARRRGELSDELVERVQGALVDEFDDTYGGFGTGQKFPHNEAIDFALLRFVKTQSPMLREVIETSLGRLLESPMHDTVDGGFFRYSAARDWRKPHTEKLLETNVGLLRNYLEAYQIFERPEYKQAAEKIVHYLREFLRHPTLAAFGGSQDSDDRYYPLSAAERKKMQPPKVDWTIYVNWNAAAVSALYKASAVLGDRSCLQLAEQTLGFLLDECYDPGRGMYHYHDGVDTHIQGLLTDQTWMARALIHAAQFTGERRYLDVAEDLLRILLQKQSASHGGFFDVRADAAAIASLRRKNQSILENGLIAEVFLRAHYLTQKEEYLETAERTLRLFAEDYHLYGYYTAGYARAVDLLLHPPVHAVIVGPRGAEQTLAMVRAASRIYLPSKLVQVIDPAHDGDLIERFQLSRDVGVAYVKVRKASVARVTDPEQLAAAMSEAQKSSLGGQIRM